MYGAYKLKIKNKQFSGLVFNDLKNAYYFGGQKTIYDLSLCSLELVEGLDTLSLSEHRLSKIDLF
jgi:hypothetical protein